MQVFRTVGKPLQILIRVTLSNETPVRRYQAYENIALSGGEAGFVGIVGRNGTAQASGAACAMVRIVSVSSFVQAIGE